MKAIDFLKKTYDVENKCNTRDRVICKDGFNVSRQGGTKYHYCRPRHHCDEYEELELGYPSELDDIIAKYAEDINTTSTVFAYVPIEVIENLIDKHGGIIGTIKPLQYPTAPKGV